MPYAKKCFDHLNNTFTSITEMCSYHNVSYAAFTNRTRNHRDWPVEWRLFGKPDNVEDGVEILFQRYLKCADSTGKI
jgi:hypothetical protein